MISGVGLRDVSEASEKMGPTVIAETEAAALIIIISGFQGKRVRHLAILPRLPLHPPTIFVLPAARSLVSLSDFHIRADNNYVCSERPTSVTMKMCMQTVHACQTTAPCSGAHFFVCKSCMPCLSSKRGVKAGRCRCSAPSAA